ncbi:REP-associated tyrosine transposase [Azohydromonas lata]|uniref:REP-associated tyrosine transposase n=1 Tax=Azohydromonas lata TaxID=45677 RepID=UPI001C3F4D32|nr:transposase [Azohydromonas lata]
MERFQAAGKDRSLGNHKPCRATACRRPAGGPNLSPARAQFQASLHAVTLSGMAHQQRLRIGRASLPGQAYHVISATQARRPVFAVPEVARVVIRVMRDMHDGGWLHSHAWVLMPDHLHWLFTLGVRANLSGTVNRFKSASAHAVRGLDPRTSPVWQAGFFDHGVRQEEELRGIARYIVANPLRAGLCERVGDYPWWDVEWL